MGPQNWTGFDRRKICPRCGGYQTRFERYTVPETAPRPLGVLRLLVVLIFVLQIGLAYLLVNQRPALDPVMVIGLLLAVILALGIFIAYRFARRDGGAFGRAIRERFQRDEADQDSAPASPSLDPAATLYFLHCNGCGYQWQKTAQEWEREGQSVSPPAAALEEDPALGEDGERIEWMPPSQARTILIITGVVIVFLLVSAVVLGMLLQRSQVDPAGKFAILNGGVLVLLLILIGVGFITKAKLARLIPVILLFVIALVLFLLIR